MFRLPACLALLGGLTGCSLTVAQADPCQTNAECRAAFGVGSVCGEGGYCEVSAPPARCHRTVPEDFFEDPSRYAGSILFGALFSETEHLDSIQASRLAVIEANGAEGIDGREFVVVYCDYGSGFGDDLDSQEASAEGARYLTETLGATAIVGPRGSSRTIAAFEALGETDAIVISPSATSPELTTVDETNPTDENPGRLWRTVPPDVLQGEVIVADMVARGVTSVAIVAQQGAYGDALSALVKSGFEGSGGTVTVLSYADSPFGAVADAAATGVDETVFISSDISDYAAFFSAAVSTANQEAAFDAMGIFLTDGAFNDGLLEPMNPAATVLFDNVRGTRPATAMGPLFNAFAGAFATEYDGENPQASGFTVHTYDAAWLVMYAHAWAHFNEEDSGGRSLARGLRRISAGDPVSIRADQWPTVLSHFEAGDGINVAGGSGELDYDPATEETSAPVQIWGIADDGMGGFEFVDIELVDP